MQEISLWLHLAIDDLETAQILYHSNLYDTAVYHCQQSAEKVLKAFLWEHNHCPEKTHDPGKLVRSCGTIDTRIKVVFVEARTLKRYATDSRYPGRYVVLQKHNVARALKAAEKIMKVISPLLQNKKREKKNDRNRHDD